MNIDLHCRLRAYAKLTVEQNGGGVGGDDFLKKIVTTPKDTLIDLGYKDSVSGREVYAVRRSFQFTPIADVEYKITLADNVERILSFNGNFKSENYSVSIPVKKVVEDIFTVDNEYYFIFTGGDYEYNFDVYFVFIGSEEYITQEDIGECKIERVVNKYSLTTEAENCSIVVKLGDEIVNPGDDALIDKETYSVYVNVEDGYELDSVYINETQKYGDQPYTFVCRENTVVRATASEKQRYDYSLSATGCTVHLTKDSESIQPGEDSLIEGESYTLSITPNDQYVYSSVTVNGDTISEESLPYTFTCTSDVTVVATYTQSHIGDGVIHIQNNSSYTVKALQWDEYSGEYDEIATANPNGSSSFNISDSYEVIITIPGRSSSDMFRARIDGLYDNILYPLNPPEPTYLTIIHNLDLNSLQIYSPNESTDGSWRAIYETDKYGCTVTISDVE